MGHWLLFLHIVGVLWFMAGHGVPLFVSHLLSRERRVERVAAYLEVSRLASLLTTGPASLLIVGSGLAMVVVRGWLRRGALWPWLSLALFLGVTLAALLLVGPHYRRLRRLVRQACGGEVSPELRRLLGRRAPIYVGYVALLALVVILYLMVFKPF